jgi:hypothetical protein
MRRFLLLLAALPLVLAPPAVAVDRGDGDRCPPPEIDYVYDSQRMAVHAWLVASGCPARDKGQFDLFVAVGRFTDDGPLDGVHRTQRCGPFPAGRHDDAPSPTYACEVDLALQHPDGERVNYDIDVTYPGANSERNTTLILRCTSKPDVAWCDE